MFFLLFLLVDRRIRIRAGLGFISVTNGFGCGSRRPKNIWILRIWIRIRNTASRRLEGGGQHPVGFIRSSASPHHFRAVP
jgi:hypothetical protein